jgi:4,5-dihydroxyphthalate decarboxylase
MRDLRFCSRGKAVANAPLSLNFAVADYPHTRAILSGRIPIEGIAPNFIKVEPQIAAYRRMVRNVEFDVCEIAPTTYIMARALGAPFVALPIFVSRAGAPGRQHPQPEGP